MGPDSKIVFLVPICLFFVFLLLLLCLIVEKEEPEPTLVSCFMSYHVLNSRHTRTMHSEFRDLHFILLLAHYELQLI